MHRLFPAPRTLGLYLRIKQKVTTVIYFCHVYIILTFLYGPRFLLLSVAFATLRLARAIACDKIGSDKGPFRLGKPSFALNFKA